MSVNLERPQSIEELRQIVRGYQGLQYRLFAGGLDVVPELRMGRSISSALIDVKRIPELGSLTSDGPWASIGAAVRLHSLSASAWPPLLGSLVPRVVSHIGNRRVRMTGTIGGNLAGGNRLSDLRLLFDVLDARIRTLDLDSAAQGSVTSPARSLPVDMPRNLLIVTAEVDAEMHRQVGYAYRRQPTSGPLYRAALVVSRAPDKGVVALRIGVTMAARGRDVAMAMSTDIPPRAAPTSLAECAEFAGDVGAAVQDQLGEVSSSDAAIVGMVRDAVIEALNVDGRV